MKKLVTFLLTVLLLSAMGCAKPTDAPASTAEAPAAEESAPEAAPSPTAEPTAKPTAKPTQMPMPAPLDAEGFRAATAQEAAEAIKSALAAYPCYTAKYEKTDYGAYVGYDETRESVVLRLTDGRGGELLTALMPLLEAGKLPRLMLDIDTGEEMVKGPLPGVKELILSTFNSDSSAFLADCPDVESLTVITLSLSDKVTGYPPAMKSLTIETADDASVDLTYLCGEDGTLLTKLTSLSVGVEGDEEPLEFYLPEDTDEPFAGLPAVTALNLWIRRDESTVRLYEKALALPQLKTLNGLGKTAFGPYMGMSMYDIQDDLITKVMAYKEEGTSFAAANGLPKTVNGPVKVLIDSESSYNLEHDSSIEYETDSSGASFYGIPNPMVWSEGMPEYNAYLAYIYEYDTVVGYYGAKEDEIWGYAVQTRMLLVELATGKIYQTTAANTNPPRTNQEDTYGDYCPLRAVEMLRKLIKTDAGPFTGYSMNDAEYSIFSWHNLHVFGYAKDGLPPAIDGKIRVCVNNAQDNIADEQYVEDSDFRDEPDEYYGIPVGCLLHESDEEGWLVYILGSSVETRQYGEEYGDEVGYSVETHLYVVDMATGKAWHKLVKTVPPPPTPEETCYGDFCPRTALSLIAPLIKYVPEESPAAE